MNKKIFNLLFTFVLFLPMTIAFTSCKDDDDDTPAYDITGEWYWESDSEWLYFEFNSGSFSGEVGYDDDNLDDIYANIRGNYTVSGNQVVIKITGCSNPYEFDEFTVGTTLTATTDGKTINLNITGINITLIRDEE